MIIAFSNFTRYNITLRQESTLFEELKHVEQYLKIYSFRQAGRVKCEVSKDPDVPNISVPFCILQPIAENCLKHGFAKITDKIHIAVHASVHPAGVEITIKDNGLKISKEDLDRIEALLQTDVGDRKGIGLANVNDRILYYCGDGYGITFSAAEPKGLICHLLLKDVGPQRNGGIVS
jgi:two-component system sensor histidine kinase YesM